MTRLSLRPGDHHNADDLASAPKKLPVGWITRDQYRDRYGADDYAAVPADSWGKGGHPDAMNPREWARVRGKRGL